MPLVVLAPAAEEDIVRILAWSHEHFGEQARLRYEALLTQAIVDIAEDPERVGSVPREELATGARTYHSWHSRQRIAKSVGTVGTPRHFLLLRITAEGQIEIGRVLHDSMDLASNLPEVYLPRP
ncbi:Plasmid stabilization system protein [Pirellula sp. SH-Sr6A]|uniref:type II toxin-antitoxin system RelE/ParE family toxin n=1 Tax=Pirellula sp. SH-Sr6A TaxID=1632865 RepID=UPI00078E07D8|nr:type II toxin-antitoxin system RelE/ParE family toxin [Pirellula sp. SH-Sr6A]AMV31531.1 Plasmid stabilization system protein [Pirellula sp. SH-Sr6A]